MGSARAYVSNNNKIHCGPSNQPCRVTVHLTVTHLMVYSTYPRTPPHTSTKRREGINPIESATVIHINYSKINIYISSNRTVSSTPGLLAQGVNPQYSLSITLCHVHHWHRIYVHQLTHNIIYKSYLQFRCTR